jgi:cellulose biosynthesis protein BcsQ
MLSETKLLAITSGKGGVGKTTLAIGMAEVLASSKCSVLLADFDFLNRGLSELIGDRGESGFMQSTIAFDRQSYANFELRRLTNRVSCLLAPRLSTSDFRDLDSRPREFLNAKLTASLSWAVEQTGADIVLIDCHGSADAVTRTAVAIASDTLIVCVPEIITFFGTKTILESLRSDSEIAQTPATRLHIIFNRVGKDFTTSILSTWSYKYFGDAIDSPRPLAVIPFDERISIATSDSLFPTETAAYAAATEKLRIAVFDLYSKEAPKLISRETKFVSKYLRAFYTPRTPPLSGILNASIPMRTLMTALSFFVAGVAALIAFPSFAELAPAQYRPTIDDGFKIGFASYTVVLFLGFWALFAYVDDALIFNDSRASGILRWGLMRKGMGHAFISTAIVFLGSLLFIALSNKQSEELPASLVAALSMAGLPAQIVEPVKAWILAASAAGTWATRVYLAVFVLIFAVRFLRTALFRPRSLEVIWRIAIAAAVGWVMHVLW